MFPLSDSEMRKLVANRKVGHLFTSAPRGKDESEQVRKKVFATDFDFDDMVFPGGSFPHCGNVIYYALKKGEE